MKEYRSALAGERGIVVPRPEDAFFGRKTLFVLGAGSSVEFKLPTGLELTGKIAQTLAFQMQHGQIARGDEVIIRAIYASFPNHVREYINAGALISRGIGLSRSVDEFLYNHGSSEFVVNIGKAAITSAILAAERNSHMMVSRPYEKSTTTKMIHGLRDTWIYKLFQLLQTGVTKENVGEIFSNVAFVNFNYDRCVEHFFYHALQAAYDLSDGEAADVMRTCVLLHPYGRVGRLAWEGSANPVAFGELPHETAIFSISREIKTFTEKSHTKDELDIIRLAVNEAYQIVFLGFGFHRQNMQLLGENPIEPVPTVYGTAYETSAANVDVFRSLIQRHIRIGPKSDIVFDDMTCSDFMDAYGLKLGWS